MGELLGRGFRGHGRAFRHLRRGREGRVGVDAPSVERLGRDDGGGGGELRGEREHGGGGRARRVGDVAEDASRIRRRHGGGASLARGGQACGNAGGGTSEMSERNGVVDRKVRDGDDGRANARVGSRERARHAPAFSSMSLSAWKSMLANAERDSARSRAGHDSLAPRSPALPEEGDFSVASPPRRPRRDSGVAPTAAAPGGRRLTPTDDVLAIVSRVTCVVARRVKCVVAGDDTPPWRRESVRWRFSVGTRTHRQIKKRLLSYA